MKYGVFLFSFFVSYFVFAQNQVFVSVISEKEGKIFKVHTDTLNVKAYYSLTGFESVGDVVLNVLILKEDGSKSRKEFDVNYYKREQDITEINVRTDDGILKYTFFHDLYFIITEDKDGSILWEGDIIF